MEVGEEGDKKKTHKVSKHDAVTFRETIKLIRDGEKGEGRGYRCDDDDEVMLNVLRCQLTC